LRAIALDAASNVIVSTYAFGTVDAGGGSLQAVPGDIPEHGDILLSKYNDAGKPIWSRMYGTELAEAVNALAVDKDGTFVVTGIAGSDETSLLEGVDFGGIASNPLPGPYWWDLFIARFAP